MVKPAARQLFADQVANRLAWAMRETQVSAAGLAKLAKVRSDAISRLLTPDKKTKRRRLPDFLVMARIARALPPMTAGWLSFGEGPDPELRPVPAEFRDQRRADTKTDGP